MRLAESGLNVLLSSAPTPSQTISHAARHREVVGGVVVTASHNPAEYNGLKFKAWCGGSALPSIYRAIEDAIDAPVPSAGKGVITEVDILSDYLSALQDGLDLDTIRGGGLTILHDPIHGVASGLPERILGDTARVVTIRGEYNPHSVRSTPSRSPRTSPLPRRQWVTGSTRWRSATMAMPTVWDFRRAGEVRDPASDPVASRSRHDPAQGDEW